MDRGCKIISLDEDVDHDDLGGHDFYELLEQAENLFDRCGVRYDECERPFEACVDPQGRVLGASSLGLYDPRGDEADPLGRPRWLFSVVVDERARRRGIAKALVESIIAAKPRESFLLEGKVVNPHMSRLLSGLGFVRAYGEDEGEEWTDLDATTGRRMYRPNPGRRDERERLARRAAAGDLAAAEALVELLKDAAGKPSGKSGKSGKAKGGKTKTWVVTIDSEHGRFIETEATEEDACGTAMSYVEQLTGYKDETSATWRTAFEKWYDDLGGCEEGLVRIEAKEVGRE